MTVYMRPNLHLFFIVRGVPAHILGDLSIESGLKSWRKLA